MSDAAAPLPTVEQLIGLVEHNAGSDDPIARVIAAAGIKQHAERVGDELLDHFVNHARTQGCSWNDIGEALGVTRQAAQQRHRGLLGRLAQSLRPGHLQRFTPPARGAVIAAQKLARERGHTPIETEHVLLGLYADEARSDHGRPNFGVLALDRLGVDPAELRWFVDSERPPAPEPVARGHIPFGKDAKGALEGALQAASQLGHGYIGGEHLVLGIVSRPSSVGARALAAEGVTRDALFATVAELVT